MYVEGKLATEKWQGRDGVERETTRIVARQVLFLGKRGEQAPAGPAAPAEPERQLDEYDLGDMIDPFAGEDPGFGS